MSLRQQPAKQLYVLREKPTAEREPAVGLKDSRRDRRFPNASGEDAHGVVALFLSGKLTGATTGKANAMSFHMTQVLDC